MYAARVFIPLAFTMLIGKSYHDRFSTWWWKIVDYA